MNKRPPKRESHRNSSFAGRTQCESTVSDFSSPFDYRAIRLSDTLYFALYNVAEPCFYA